MTLAVVSTLAKKAVDHIDSSHGEGTSLLSLQVENLLLSNKDFKAHSCINMNHDE